MPIIQCHMVSRLILRSLEEDAAVYCGSVPFVGAIRDAYLVVPGEPITQIHPLTVGELSKVQVV
jgi:hypothetical protein